MTDHSQRTSLRSAVILSLASSTLVPLVGIVSAPILAIALGPGGRGTVAAAIAPNVLIAAVATMGLPEALTFVLARFPQLIKRALLWSAAITVAVGITSLAVTFLLLPVLSTGDRLLAHLIAIGTAITLPQLWVNLLRGAASGLQRWRLVALEKVSVSLLRLCTLLALFLLDRLTVTSAVLTLVLCPLASGLVYLGLLRTSPGYVVTETAPRIPGALLDFGVKVWAGSVAGIVLAKLGTVMFAPLSNVDQLGLYVVGVTIADVPIVMAVALRDALFGVNSRTQDLQAFARATRIGIAAAVGGMTVLATTLPLWIGPVFGPAFIAALPVTWLLMICALANVPSFLLAGGLSAWGRPGLRSLVIAGTVVIDVVLFVLLVPAHGAIGAALANLASSGTGAVATVALARRILGSSTRDLIVLHRADVTVVVHAVARRLRPRAAEQPQSTDGASG